MNDYEARDHRGGVTLIEAMFVLGILALILGFVALQMSASSRHFKDDQTVAEVSRIAIMMSNIVRDTHTNPTSADLIAYGLPSKFVKGNAIITPYGGIITLGATNGGYGLIVPDLTQASCYEISSDIDGELFSSIEVNGNSSSTTIDRTKACSGQSNSITLSIRSSDGTGGSGVGSDTSPGVADTNNVQQYSAGD